MPVLTEKQQRRRKNYRSFKRIRSRIGSLKGITPDRNPIYLAWIRLQPCLLAPGCQCSKAGTPFFLRIVEAAHTGPHGFGQKASDYSVIPLCRFAHQEAKNAQGKSRNWFEEHGLDRLAILAELRERFEQERAA